MKYASGDLINEHEGILSGLKILERFVYLIKEKNSYEINDLNEMTHFFKLFADECHHGKEEGILFPALEDAGVSKKNGLIGELLKDHAEARKYIAQMDESTSKDVFDKNNFVKAAANYITLLRSHIDRENYKLFPLCNEELPPDKQNNLLKLFEIHEEKAMGKGTHEKLHELLHKFENKYLIMD